MNAFEVLMCKSKIRCDLCSTLVHNYEFDEPYQNCNGPIYAFNILLNVEKRQPQNRSQNHLDDHPTTSSNALKRMRMYEGKEVLNQGKNDKISENKKDLKLELLCPTYGDKYLVSRERQHILTDKHKNASAREVKNNENIILLNS